MELCSTCKTGAKFIDDEPLGCPFTGKLKDGECGMYAKMEVQNESNTID